MLLVFTAFALVASVPLAGGRLSRLADVRLRAVWTVFLSVAIQVAITTVAPGGSHLVHVVLHLISYVLAAWFLVANRHVPGILLLALGAGLNVLAISLNGGVMPASVAAIRIAGLQPGSGFHNSAPLAHPHLAFLGDIIPVPGPWPIGNVLSAGDLIIVAGALDVLHRACGSRLPLPALRRAARPQPAARALIAPAGAVARGAGCAVRGARCAVRGAGCGVRGAGCGVRGAGGITFPAWPESPREEHSPRPAGTTSAASDPAPCGRRNPRCCAAGVRRPRRRAKR